LFGYVVGLETALGSYVFGRTVAWWLHQWRNPELALEQDAIKICKSHGVAVNHSLPVLERRYLHSLFEDPANDGSISSNHLYLSPTAMLTREELAPLTRWRDSTREARLLGSGEQAKNLMELETALLAERKDITDEMCSMASANGWDMHSMREWLSRRYNQYENDANVGGSGYQLTSAGVYKTLSEENSIWYSVPMAATLLLLCLSVLIFLLYFWSGAQTSYEITYRTMAYAMVYATPGALLRWGLSGWNGTLNHRDWNWLPIGTLAANILGAMVSISMIGWEYNLGMADVSGYWAVATVRAIKIGFSGCLTTVSTMVSEVHTLTQMRQDRGYKYILITLTMSCTLAMILFLIIV
jgi:fluoride ion exporter CrcB/FEX